MIKDLNNKTNKSVLPTGKIYQEIDSTPIEMLKYLLSPEGKNTEDLGMMLYARSMNTVRIPNIESPEKFFPYDHQRFPYLVSMEPNKGYCPDVRKNIPLNDFFEINFLSEDDTTSAVLIIPKRNSPSLKPLDFMRKNSLFLANDFLGALPLRFTYVIDLTERGIRTKKERSMFKYRYPVQNIEKVICDFMNYFHCDFLLESAQNITKLSKKELSEKVSEAMPVSIETVFTNQDVDVLISLASEFMTLSVPAKINLTNRSKEEASFDSKSLACRELFIDELRTHHTTLSLVDKRFLRRRIAFYLLRSKIVHKKTENTIQESL